MSLSKISRKVNCFSLLLNLFLRQVSRLKKAFARWERDILPRPLRKCRRATYTVEASVVMPVYLCLSASIFLFFHVFSVSWGVQVAANETARLLALGGEMDDGRLLAANVALAGTRIAGEHLPVKHIRGGLLGINFMASEVDEQDIHLIASYDLPLPVRMFRIKHFTAATSVRARRWVGYDPHEGENGAGFVYVTEYGRVYHTTTSCAYLDLSVHSAAKDSVGVQRNRSGKKYHKCPMCRSDGSIVYITDYGTDYHGSLACSGLKRTIYQIKEAEAKSKGLGGCSKCGR